MTEKRRRTKSPDQDALEHIIQGEDKAFLEGRFINKYNRRGVFTREYIRAKSFVVEYRGVLSLNEGADDKNNKYVLDFMWNEKQYRIDASIEDGTLGRLVNDEHVHPNCKVRRIMVQGRPHLCLFAIREIFPGEEITYNRAGSSWPWHSVFQAPCEASRDLKVNGSEPAPEKDATGGNDDQVTGVSSNPAVSKDDACHHIIAYAALSDLDNCADCSGPFCSKWLGFTCKLCSTSWHKSCFLKTKPPRVTETAKSSSTETSAAREGSSRTQKNYCYICKKPQSKISHHLSKHKNEDPDIAEAFLLPKKSKERRRLLEKLRNKGNYEHNQGVMRNNGGTLEVKRRQGPSEMSVDAEMYVRCTYCKGMFVLKELWRHSQRCPSRTVSETEASVKSKALANTAEPTCSQAISTGVWKVLGKMRDDEVASVVRNDFLILQLAQTFYNKHGSDPTKFEHIRTKVREMGRLLLTLRQKYSLFSFEDAVKPNNFYKIIAAVKTVAEYAEEKHSHSTPSRALRLGHSLKMIGDIILCRAISAEDGSLIKAAERFTELCTKEWTEQVSHTAPDTLIKSKLSKPSTIPFTEDVQLLHKYLEGKSAGAIENLKEHQSPRAYAELARVTLAQIILFNRCRAGEVSKMTLESFKERDRTQLHSDLAASLSLFEQKLVRHFSRVEVMGKNGRKVAVLLNPDVVSAAVLLTEKRDTCKVHKDNPFLFGRPQGPPTSSYRGQDCIRMFTRMCGAKNPENLSSAHLRKHVATLSQILSLQNNELDPLSSFLSLDVRVRRDFHRLPEAAVEVAKISKLVLAMEKGTLGKFQGKSLDEIEIEDELDLELDEGEQDGGDDEDDGDSQAEGDDDGIGDNEGDEDGGKEESDCALGLRGKRKRTISTQTETKGQKKLCVTESVVTISKGKPAYETLESDPLRCSETTTVHLKPPDEEGCCEGAVRPAVLSWRRMKSQLQPVPKHQTGANKQPEEEPLERPAAVKRTDVSFRDFFRDALEASLEASVRSRSARQTSDTGRHDGGSNLGPPPVEEKSRPPEESCSSCLNCARLQRRLGELSALSGEREDEEASAFRPDRDPSPEAVHAEAEPEWTEPLSPSQVSVWDEDEDRADAPSPGPSEPLGRGVRRPSGFRTDWLNTFWFLQYSPVLDHMWCRVCRLYGEKAHQRLPMVRGCNAFTLEGIKKHSECQYHANCVRRHKRNRHVLRLLDAQTQS